MALIRVVGEGWNVRTVEMTSLCLTTGQRAATYRCWRESLRDVKSSSRSADRAPGWLLWSKSHENKGKGSGQNPIRWTVSAILQAVLTPILCIYFLITWFLFSCNKVRKVRALFETECHIDRIIVAHCHCHWVSRCARNYCSLHQHVREVFYTTGQFIY